MPIRTTSTVLAVLLACACLLPSPLAAEDKNFKDIAKRFKKEYDPEDTSIKNRQQLIKELRRTDDGRAIPLLLDALGDQRKHVERVLKKYEEGMTEWQEKTARLEAQREERFRRHRERAEKKGEKPGPISVDLNSESGRWLGAPPKHVGEMEAARKRLMKQYDDAREEREIQSSLRRAIASVLRDVEGDPFDKAVNLLIKDVRKTKDKHRLEMLALLGYIRGDQVTAHLVKETEDRDTAIVEAALGALGRQNTDQGKEILLKFLEHDDWGMRSAALDGLVFYRDPAVMDALLARAEKEEGTVRRRIFQTMAAIVGEPVKAVIEAWKSWWPSNREEVIAKWKRMPREGPVTDDPPKLPIETEGSGEGTSFYGIKTDSKHIIFVADISGSMRRAEDQPEDEPAKIDVCRDELKRAIRGLSAKDEDDRGAASFNIVLFSTDPLVYKPGKMVKATKKNKEKAFKWIDEHVKPEMQTNIFDAVEQAFNIVSARSAKKNRERGADTIFLMTDGVPSRGKFVRPEVILEEITRLNKGRGLTIHTVGVGKGHHKGFLQALATQNGGQYLSRE